MRLGSQSPEPGKTLNVQRRTLKDHLWREAEGKLGPTEAQLATLDERVANGY